MAKVNICLRRSFITVAGLIGFAVGMILSSLFLFASEVNGLVKKPEVLSVVFSVLILCRLNRKEDTPAVVYSGEA